MTQSKTHRILVSPLEWGLGHATRLTRMIRILQEHHFEVILAADGLPFNFLSEQFPDLILERLPMKQIRYSKGSQGFFIRLLLQLPGLFFSIKNSRKRLQELVDQYQPDFILSDNRYGFRHPDVPSVFVTHQLRPMPPKAFRFFQSAFGRFHLWMLRGYDFIWVSDFDGEDNVAGALSRIPWKNNKIRYIGPLSWLSDCDPVPPKAERAPDLLFLLSGPEPQRELLEQHIIQHFQGFSKPMVLLQGLPQEKGLPHQEKDVGGIRILNHLPGNQILWYLQNAKKIVCRAGVVTVFDLVVLGIPAILIPSPGQTEQEYVAHRLHQKGYFQEVPQSEFTTTSIDSFEETSFKTFPASELSGLESAISELVSRKPE